MLIKDLDKSFLEKISAMEMRVHRNPWSQNVISMHLANPISITKGIIIENKLVAYLLGQHFDFEFHILNLAVDSDYRRVGLGQNLLSQSISQLSKQGVKTCLLEARPSNIAACNLYKKIGFKTIAVRKRYYQDNLEDALVMTLEIEEQKPYLSFDNFNKQTTEIFNKNKIC